MNLYEAHKDHRDKFEVLAFHDATVKTFAELDEKLERVKKSYWGGKDLPFPILLDATGQTIQTYGIRAYPTTILIDPDGKLVGEANEELLEAKLPPLPVGVRVARAIDANVTFTFNDPTLGEALKQLSRVAKIDIRPDEAALKAAGVTPETKIPLQIAGLVSLRSTLNLLLGAHDLTFVQDDKGLLVTTRKPGSTTPAELSEPQRICAKRIETMLDGKMSFDLQDKTLAEVCQYFEQATQENFVLDPAARRAGRLDPATKVSGSAKDGPLREGLEKLLGPLGLMAVVRDEVVVITPRSK
jgi:hypothetical protein